MIGAEVLEHERSGVRGMVSGALHLAVWGVSFVAAAVLLGTRGGVGRSAGVGELASVAALFLLIKASATALTVTFPELRRNSAREALLVLAGLVMLTSALLALLLAVVPMAGVRPLLAPLDGAISLTLMLTLGLVPRAHWIREAREAETAKEVIAAPAPATRTLPKPPLDLDDLLRGDQLLDRPPIALDEAAIARLVQSRRVLVTGAGGSIGSELARQLLRYAPGILYLADRSENALFWIDRDLRERVPSATIETRLVDVRDGAGVARLFATARPDVVFHAAAHKHVPMMERHPSEAVLNNVLGTRTVGDAAHRANVETFVFISTDKAVNPTSVMGATKRLGELYVQGMARRSHTRFVAVRFGNVLGSSGSVLPIWLEQIRRGGPVTVTHPEMRRYFMSIPEACRLVLQAGALGGGGEVFVLDMGQPVKIVDLARRMIERAGFTPDRDVSIVFSGPRPGEKLFEQLTLADEAATQTRHPGIWIGKIDEVAWPRLSDALEALFDLALRGADSAVVRAMAELIPEYLPELPAEEMVDDADDLDEVAEPRVAEALNAGGE